MTQIFLVANISKRLKVEAQFQWTTNRKWLTAVPQNSGLIISKTAGDTVSATVYRAPIKMAYGVSSGHISDDVTYPRYVWAPMTPAQKQDTAQLTVYMKSYTKYRFATISDLY